MACLGLFDIVDATLQKARRVSDFLLQTRKLIVTVLLELGELFLDFIDQSLVFEGH